MEGENEHCSPLLPEIGISGRRVRSAQVFGHSLETCGRTGPSPRCRERRQRLPEDRRRVSAHLRTQPLAHLARSETSARRAAMEDPVR